MMVDVLHVNGDKGLQTSTKEFLENLGGLNVVQAWSAMEAIEILEDGQFDVVVCASNMDDMSALEVLKYIRSKGDHTPFILFTGKGREDMVIEALNHGADFYVQVNGSTEGDLAELHNRIKQSVDRQRAEEEMRLTGARLEALIRLNQMSNATLSEITNFAMEEAIRLTQSKIGYVAFINEDETVLTMYAWSRSAMNLCKMSRKPRIYEVIKTGLWGEAVRQRGPVITNDYSAPNELKKGYPEGHVNIRSHMNVPIIDGEHIVLVAGVGNKETDYTEMDVREVTLLMDGMWNLIKKRKAEKALKQSEEYLRAIIDSVQAGIVIIDAETHDIVDANPVAVSMIGAPKEEIVGKKCYDHFSNKEWCTCPITDLDQEIDNSEKPLVRANGEVMPILKTVVPIMLNGRRHLVESFLDISEQRREIEKLSRFQPTILSSRKITEFINYNPALLSSMEAEPGFINVIREPSLMLGGKGKVVSANEAAARFFGLPPENIVGIRLWELPFPNVAGSENIEDISRTWSGPMGYDMTIFPIMENGKDSMFVVIHDMDEREMVMKAMKKSINRVNILNSISRHDITKHINVLESYLEIGREVVKDKEVKGLLEKMEEAVLSINELIDFTKDYQKIGIMEPRWQSIIELIETTSKSDTLGLIDIGPNVKGLEVFADPMLREVFLQLAENSVHHGGDVSRILIDCREDGNGLTLIISDDGDGIMEGLKECIFEMDFNDDSSRGLFLARKILGITNMTIRETGIQGEGARFEISIPNGYFRFESSW